MNQKSSDKIEIEWMHPSWRDLVIDHLRKNSVQRKRFLDACGLNGFLLALSQAGGESGERRWPLLVDNEDWLILIRSVERVVRSKDQAAWSLLGHLIQKDGGSNRTKERNKTDRFDELLTEVLMQIKIRWDTDETPAIATLVSWFYKLSEKIHPLPHGPNLDRIWKAYWDAAESEVEAFEPNEIDGSVNETTELFQLGSIAQQNEPRFVRQICFPACCEDLANTLLEKMEERAALEIDFDHSDECDSETSLLWAMQQLTETILNQLPTLADRANPVLETLTDNYDRVNDLMSELKAKEDEKAEAEEEKLKQKRDSNSVPQAAWVGTQRWISIEEVFSDL